MGLSIEKGRQPRPPKVVIYGPEGVGKTTLASKFPRPLFIDFEGGTARMDVERIRRPSSMAELNAVLDELQRDHGDYRTLVLDTADWMEQLIVDAICAEKKVKSIGEIAYGQGYNLVADAVARLLDRLARLQSATGMAVVVCAHATQRKVDNPEQMSTYDHWELKLTKKASPLVKEWADFLLFYKFESDLVKDGDKTKAVGMVRRVCSGHTAWFDAKSREPLLKAQVQANDAGIEHLLSCIFQTVDPRDEVKPQNSPETQPAQTEAETADDQRVLDGTPATREYTERQSKLCDLMIATGVRQSELDMVVSRMGILPAGTDLHAYNDATCDRLINNWTKVQNNIAKLKK